MENDKLQPRVYIVILNWNGWRDTIECLESVFRNAYSNYKVIVCDNASSDNSLEKIKEWADGMVPADIAQDTRNSVHTTPPVLKPIKYIQYTREQVECSELNNQEDPPLTLIQTGDNLGFAGGNNVGMRYALVRDDFSYIWLLNNDTVIDSSALVHGIARIGVQSSIGICGSKLFYYDEPDTIQALGGATYNKWLGVVKHIGVSKKIDAQYITQQEVERTMDYVIGASMLVSKKFLQDIGLMCEDYFLYYEEVDWATRAKGKYVLAYAPHSIVYHKEGRTTGASLYKVSEKSKLSDYYSIKNRLLFTKKYFPYALPIVCMSLFGVAFNRISRKQYDRVYMIIKILWDIFNGDRADIEERMK